MIHRRRVFFSVLVGFLVEALNKVAPLLILHFAQKKIGIERFGYAQFGMTLVDFTLPFIIFGFNAVASIEIGRMQNDKERVGTLLSEIMLLKIFHAIICFGVLLILTHFVEAYGEYRSIVWSLGFVMFFAAIELQHVHLGTQKMVAFGLFTGLAKIISLALVFLFVSRPEDAIWYAVFTLAANALVNFFTVIYGIHKFPLRIPSFSSIKKIYASSMPFAVVLILMGLSEKFDMFLANAFFGNVGAGLYAGPVRIAQSLYSAVMTIAVVFFSELVALSDKEAFTVNLKLGFWCIMAFVLPVASGIWFVDRDLLILVFGEGFSKVGPVLSFLVLGVAAHAFISIFGFQVLLLRRSFKLIAFALLLGGLSGVGLAIFLTPTFGLSGIAAATFIGKLLAGLVVMIGAKRFLTSLPFKEFLNTGLPSCLMFFVLFAFGFTDFVSNVLTGFGVYLLFLFWFNRHNLIEVMGHFRRAAQSKVGPL